MSNQSSNQYDSNKILQKQSNTCQLVAKSLISFYLNKCYPLIKLQRRSYWFSVLLLAFKSALLLLANIDQEIKDYLDISKSSSISSRIDSINYNMNNSYRQRALQFILVVNIYILLILAFEFFITVSNTFQLSKQVVTISEDDKYEQNFTKNAKEHQNQSQYFNRSLTSYKILSLLLQSYPYIIYIPSLSISLQNFNTLAYINIPITIIINLFVSFHEFNYEFSPERDYLARRNFWSQLIIFVLDTITICVLQLQQNSSILLASNIFHFLYISAYEYYYVPIIQNQIQYVSLGLYVMKFFVTSQILFNKQLSVNVDSFLSFFFIGPLSFKIGYNLAQYRIDSIFTINHQKFKKIYQQMSLLKTKKNNILHQYEQDLIGNNTLSFEIYVRFLVDNVKCFFDDFSNSQYGILLQDIIELHKENCFGSENITSSSCFCRIVKMQEDTDRNEFLGSKWRFQFLNNYIIELFMYQIQKLQKTPIQESQQKKNKFFQSNEKANILKFQFISYLIEVQKNETLALKELLSLGKDIFSDQENRSDERDYKQSKNKQTEELSYRDQLMVRYMYQRSLYSFKFQQQIHLRNKQHEKYLLFSIMSFDERMYQAQKLLKNCIEEKSILIKSLSLSEINLEQVFHDGQKLRQLRLKLMKVLKQLINLNSYCAQLEEMCQFFDSTINFDSPLIKVLRKKKEREGEQADSKRKQIFFTLQKFYSPDSAVCFVSLMGRVGDIVKISNNFSQIIPNFINKENKILGTSINCMIPQQLHAAHDAILHDFGKSEIMQTALKDLPLIIGVDKNGFSVPYQLKLQTYHNIINHDLGICTWIKRLNLSNLNKFSQDIQFINANLNQNACIINTSEPFFEQVIHKNFHQREMNSISLYGMIPALEGIIKDFTQKSEVENHSKFVGEIYETLLVQVNQDQKQINWMKDPSRSLLLNQLSKMQLYWIQMEVNIIKNKYMNVLQLEIKSMKNLHLSTQNVQNSIDVSNGFNLKIEGIKSLCIQLMSICGWTQEEISSQLMGIVVEDTSPINRQTSYKHSQGSFDISPQYRKGSLNQSNLSLYKKYHSIQFGNKRKYSNQEKDYELIQLQEVKQVEEEEDQNEKNNNVSLHQILIPNISQIPLTNRENQSLIDIQRSDRGLVNTEEINQINYSNNNFLLKKSSMQEDKNYNFLANSINFQNSDSNQVNKLNLNNISIEHMAFSPNYTNDSSPFYQLTHSVTQNQINATKNILNPHRQSTSSFPFGSNFNNQNSTDKNTSKEDSSPAILKAKIFKSSKKIQKGQQIDYEGSVNSSKTSHDGLKREILQKIKSQRKISILIGINIIGICTILGLYLLNIYNFNRLNTLLRDEKTAFHLIDWCSSLRLSYAYSLSDVYLLVMMQLKIVQFTSINQLQDYQIFALERLNNSYKSYKQLMIQFTNQDKSQVDVFNTLLNTKYNNSLYSTQKQFFNITMNLDYALITQLGNIAMIANLNDKTQIHQLNANQNYEGIITHLIDLQDQNNQKYNSLLVDMEQNQINQMIYVLVTTFVISLSILPTYSFIQMKREEILKLLSTISPDKLKVMMANLLKSRQRINEMLLQQKNSFNPEQKNNQASLNEIINKKKKGQQSTAISLNEDDLFYLAQTQIQKKRNISNIKPLNKLNIKLLIQVLVFFVMMQVYSILVLFFVSKFKTNSISNRTIMNALTQTKSQISAQFAMNQVMNIVILAPQLISPPYDSYFRRAYYLSDQTNQVLNDLYEAQQEIHSFDRYEQGLFDSFLKPVFEKDACTTLNMFSIYTIGTNFNFSKCKTVQGGLLNNGLINSVKEMTILLTQQVDLIRINNKQLYQQQLNIFQKQNSFYDLDQFRNQIDSTINSSLEFMYHVSDNLFNYMITANIILISIQSLFVVLLIIFGWLRYYSQIQTLLIQTKHILDLFEIQILMDNSYIVTYLKKSL